MTTTRRDLLRWTGALGALSMMAPALVPRARAASTAWTGRVWLFVHADGGWDPTLLCDPKGRASPDAPDPVNTYGVDEIGQAGPFRYAPVEGHAAFFQRFRDSLLVLNGVDCQTNSHEVGTRATWSGTSDMGAPALGALVAAHPAERPAMSWLAQGGYTPTDGLLAETRLSDTRTVLEIAYPDRLDADDPDSALFTGDTLARLAAARQARLERQLAASTLAREQRLLTMLGESRAGDNALAALAEVLPDALEGGDLRRQVQLAMACFASGVSIASTVRIGGFDTHGDHDRTHTPRVRDLLDGVTFAWDEARRLGVEDRLVVVVGSDFGRTPWYNDGQGKDHWSISSMMLMGAGIDGGRVIGATDARQSPLDLDPTTLATVPTGGVRLTNGHVHAALRHLAGVDAWDAATRWPVGPLLPLLG